MLKLNDALVMMLPLVVGLHIKQSVKSVREATTASRVDNAASPDWHTPLNGIISPSERLITAMQKQLENRESI